MLSRIFTGPFLITIFRYLLNAVGVWLVANGYLSEDVWVGVSGGVLMIVTTILGGVDAAQNKVTIDGRSVRVTELPPTVQHQVEAVVPAARRRTLLDIFFGR